MRATPLLCSRQGFCADTLWYARGISTRFQHSALSLFFNHPRSEVAAQGASGLTCCNLQNAIQEALAKVDAAMDLSQFDSNGDGAVDLVTVCVMFSFSQSRVCEVRAVTAKCACACACAIASLSI